MQGNTHFQRASQANRNVIRRICLMVAVMALATVAAAACILPQCHSCSNPNPPPTIGGQVDLYDDDFIPAKLCFVGPCQPFTC